MTDMQKIREMLDRCGIRYTVDLLDDERLYAKSGYHKLTVGVEGQEKRKVAGYGAFFTEMIFDIEEAFVSIGIWE